jgi:hypothetical protein
MDRPASNCRHDSIVHSKHALSLKNRLQSELSNGSIIETWLRSLSFAAFPVVPRDSDLKAEFLLTN